MREAVARHPSTPPEALAGMAGELDRRRDLSVARALARNPSTPSGALEEWPGSGTGSWRALARRALRERAGRAAEAVLDGAERVGAEMEDAVDAGADGLDEALGLGRGAKVGWKMVPPSLLHERSA